MKMKLFSSALILSLAASSVLARYGYYYDYHGGRGDYRYGRSDYYHNGRSDYYRNGRSDRRTERSEYRTEHINANQIQEDGPIVAWLIVLDKNEISAANEASKRKLNPDVARFAKVMKKDHSKNLQDTIALSKKIPAIRTSTAVSLQQQGQHQLRYLKALDDTSFQKAYLDNMVKGHEQVLEIINSEYVKNANNPELKRHLERTRAAIMRHLERAKEIDTQLT